MFVDHPDLISGNVALECNIIFQCIHFKARFAVAVYTHGCGSLWEYFAHIVERLSTKTKPVISTQSWFMRLFGQHIQGFRRKIRKIPARILTIIIWTARMCSDDFVGVVSHTEINQSLKCLQKWKSSVALKWGRLKVSPLGQRLFRYVLTCSVNIVDIHPVASANEPREVGSFFQLHLTNFTCDICRYPVCLQAPSGREARANQSQPSTSANAPPPSFNVATT